MPRRLCFLKKWRENAPSPVRLGELDVRAGVSIKVPPRSPPSPHLPGVSPPAAGGPRVPRPRVQLAGLQCWSTVRGSLVVGSEALGVQHKAGGWRVHGARRRPERRGRGPAWSLSSVKPRQPPAERKALRDTRARSGKVARPRMQGQRSWAPVLPQNRLSHMKQQIRNFLFYFYCKICTGKGRLVWKSSLPF